MHCNLASFLDSHAPSFFISDESWEHEDLGIYLAVDPCSCSCRYKPLVHIVYPVLFVSPISTYTHMHTVLGGSTVIVTDSWIVLSSVHTVNIIHQRDAVLKLVPSNTASSLVHTHKIH